MRFGVHGRTGAVHLGAVAELDETGRVETTVQQRAGAVLAELKELAGSPNHDALMAQNAKSNVSEISRGTYYAMLNGTTKPREATLTAFVVLCLDYARAHRRTSRLTAEQYDTGYWINRYHTALGRPAASSGEHVGMPPERVAGFVPRPVLETSDAPLRVLTGLSGVGKTQLAADWIRKRWCDPATDVVMWVPAGSRADIVATYAQAAKQVLGADPKDTVGAVRQLLSWLSTNDRWLIVLDDVSVPQDLRELWPPPAGQTVITTCYRGAGWDRQNTEVIPVDKFTPAEAVSYLESRDIEDAGDLADALGHLPLALAQMVAYMINTQTTVQEYRALFADRNRTVSELMPVAAEVPDDHRGPVATTWSLLEDRAAAVAPAARPLLRIAALLDPNGIPPGVFTSAAVLGYLNTPNADPHTCREALRVLHRFTLLTVDRGSAARGVTMHTLVQRVTREVLSPTDDAPRVAADALAELPACERDVAVARHANTEALLANSEAHLWATAAHPVLEEAGRGLGMAGLAQQATDYFSRLVALATDRLGPDHPDTLTYRHEVAVWRTHAGDPAVAAGELRALLADRVRVLGHDDPRTLITRHNLARCEGDNGNTAGAATTLGDVLADQTRLLGVDHPQTMVTRANRAHYLGESGDAAGAVREYEQLLTIRLRVLGPEHRDTLMTRHNLARWRGSAGDAAGAVTALEQLLPDWARLFGPTHVDTLLTRHELAHWRGMAGDTAGAVTGYEELLSDRERVLGPAHPHTLSNRSNLARWQAEAGDVAGAVAALAQVLTDMRRILGPEHPTTRLVHHRLEEFRVRAEPG